MNSGPSTAQAPAATRPAAMEAISRAVQAVLNSRITNVQISDPAPMKKSKKLHEVSSVQPSWKDRAKFQLMKPSMRCE